MDAVDELHPRARARHRQALPDAHRGRHVHHRPWHRRDRQGRAGQVKVGEEVEIVGLRATQKTVVTGVEMFRKLLDQGQAGDNIGALLRGTKKEDVERGQVLCKPGSITPHTNFEANVYVLTKEEGGRHKPFFTNYRPQFYFRTTDVTGSIALPEGTEMVMPGRQHRDDRRAAASRSPWTRASVRHPRGWPHRRRRPRHQDPQVGIRARRKGTGTTWPTAPRRRSGSG